MPLSLRAAHLLVAKRLLLQAQADLQQRLAAV
jgi:hypothetical protein